MTKVAQELKVQEGEARSDGHVDHMPERDDKEGMQRKHEGWSLVGKYHPNKTGDKCKKETSNQNGNSYRNPHAQTVQTNKQNDSEKRM